MKVRSVSTSAALKAASDELTGLEEEDDAATGCLETLLGPLGSGRAEAEKEEEEEEEDE